MLFQAVKYCLMYMKFSASQISSGKEVESGGSKTEHILVGLEKSTCVVDGHNVR